MKALFVLAVALVSCSKNNSTPPDESAEASQARLIEKGRQSYQINCTACHHSDPKKDGALGPAVAGASFDLLNARIMTGTYPLGYKPKRPSASMLPLPHLKGDIEALTAFLNSI